MLAAVTAALALSAVLIASNVTVHLEVIESLPEEQVTRFMIRMQGSFESALGAKVSLDAVRGPRCDERPRCLDVLRERHGGGEVLLVRLIGAVRRTSISVETCDKSGACRQAERMLKNADEASWDATFTAIASELFPNGLPAEPEPPPPPPQPVVEKIAPLIDAPPVVKEGSLNGWLVGGGIGAGVLGGLGIVLSHTASMNAANNASSPEELRSAIDTGNGLSIGGTVLLGAGAALVVTALVLYAGEE
jgi:hypothetical protein